jgi:glycosyltransferase involved in cell wall biosynthesis
LDNQAACGLTAESESPQALADAVDTLAAMPDNDLKKMGENASRYYRKSLSLKVGVGKFAEVFESLGLKVRGAGQ